MPGLPLEWHLTYLGNKPTRRAEKFKEEVAPPWPLMPKKLEKKRRNNRSFQAQLDLSKDIVPKDAKLANSRAERVAKGKAECKVQIYTRKLY